MTNIRKVPNQKEGIYKNLVTIKSIDLCPNLWESDYIKACLTNMHTSQELADSSDSFTIETPIIKHHESDNQINHWLHTWFKLKQNDSESLDVRQDETWVKEYLDSDSYIGDIGVNCRIEFIPGYTRIDTSHFENTLLSLLNPSEFDYGYTCEAESYLARKLSENKLVVLNTLNAIYLANYHNEWITLGIMQLLSHIDWDLVKPMGQTMAMATLSYKNDEIIESGIRAFEMWNRKECLPMLEVTALRTNWLERYKQAVISDIRKFGI